MATWKERGEVPDSEDEFDFDSDEPELPPLHQSTTTKDADPTLPTKRQDIWDIPTSSIEGDLTTRPTEPTRPRTPAREPYTQLLSSPLSEPPSDLSSGPEDSPAPERRTVRLPKTYARQLSPDPLANDVETPAGSTTPVQVAATLHDPETAIRGTTPAQAAAASHDIETPVGSTQTSQAVATPRLDRTEHQGQNRGDHHVPVSPILSSRDLPDNSTRDSVFPTYDERIHGPLVPVRKFRPRKPIQEHPYALENARYSSTFKSHGLKPLRFEGGSQSTPRRRAAQEDSQETEFQDESQETGDAHDGTQETADGHLPTFSEESQLDTQFDERHFSVADEPLPTAPALFVEDSAETVEPLPEANKLTGLGPFGTQPTHHFEIFPLDTDIFFHESTLLGSGRVKATGNWDDDTLAQLRPRISFTLDGKPLRWGPWDDQVSSELGNLMDWLSDHFQGGHDTPNAAHSPSALQASDFVLSYVQDSLSLPDLSAKQYFASRIIETMGGFLDRFKFAQDHNELRAAPEALNVLCRMLVAVSTCTHICRQSSVLMDVRIPMEDLLTKASRTTARALLSNGIDEVLQFLEDSRQLSFRQRGIRPRHAVVHAWVVLMTVLEVASIPRSGFWDIVYSVLIPKDINLETNSEKMEKLWKTMFALLPLREFDSQGVVSPGIRRLVSMDGWALPQRLIKRVFELYKQNDRQAASFNDYCRALVSRCHYLAREWGWSKCGGIIGTIFDFFGSQNLSHLRNEEAYKSPRFLEELASGPTLAVEREDRCFHIFLKFVAVAIKRLRNGKASNEIRNLIARLMPNHSRVYLKEQSLYSHDLASLRNHHDLLCTLFWTAPQDLRPGAHLIEALIKPADTHKDACLVNLRAWIQLARYVVSTEDDDNAFNVFRRWQRNIFRQLMDQFETAASDAQQQYMALSKEDSQGITQTRIDLVVSANKMAAKEIIYACVNASRDVLSYARSVPAATFALNTRQLEEVFRHFSVSPPTLDWAVLRSSLDTINSYLFKVDSICQQQQSQSASGRNDCMSQIMALLYHELSSSLFSAARCIMATDGIQPKSATAMVDKSVCVELVIVLAAKLFAGFSKAGLVDGSKALSPGKYGLFGKEIHKLPLGHRTHLVLFIAILLKQGLWEVDALGPSLLEVWLLAIVKPRQFLAYETQLAEGLKQRNEPFVSETVVGLSIDPDYGSNRKLFQAAVTWMRQSLRDAPAGTRRALVSAHSATLQTVMDQIKSDLRVMVLDSTEHPSYVAFIRDIISLLRSHGTDICAIDEFFYQINNEYSPSLLDPRLHVAGITSYGLRLGEGDMKIVPQLFYYLYNNFKVALLNDKLGNEARMLRRGMKDDRILGFVLGQMVPAIAKAAVRVGGVFPLLDVYCDALAHVFIGDIAGRELTEEDLAHVLLLVQTVLRCLCDLGTGGDASMSAEQLHVTIRLCGIVNVFWPPMQALCYTDSAIEGVHDLELLFGRLRGWLDATISHLDSAIVLHDAVPLRSELFAGLQGVIQSLPQPATATMFPESIITDVRKNWVISDSAITIRAPGKARGPSSTQSGQGIRKPAWDAFELLGSLSEELKVWRIRQGETFPGEQEGWRGGARGASGSLTDGLIF
ncbi:uncharacterized protein DNG_08332 [Cephalotrichum gorgonifer]|uniref:Uncharacterized protein n=1 Tax=Cephalotrichum gorgonifer TaxID=2041049 RepID=A0AAE8N3J5_9PEZI|nr:uncharacterized protein DNG_08332 [Cephalotrichum gorgonifer]